VFDDTDSNDQRATARQEIMRILDASYAEILKEKKSLPRLNSVLDFFIFRDSCIATYTTGHWRWWPLWPAYSST